MSSAFLITGLPLFVLVALQEDHVRHSFGDTAATALEQLVTRLYPGSRVVWKNSAWLERPGELARELLLPGFVQRPINGNGFLFATAIEFPEEQRRLIDASRAGARPPQPYATTRLAEFITDSRGTLREYVSGTLEDGEDPTLCTDIRIVTGPGTWPRLRVRYRTFHYTAARLVAIEWTALLASETFTPLERLPLSVWTRYPDGVEHSVILGSRRVAPGIVEIAAPADMGDALRVACGEQCVVPKDAIVKHEWR